MVFRWVGVAAPAQRCFQGLCFDCAAVQYGTDGGPGARGLRLPGVSGTRPLMQSGSGRCEIAVMAWPPSSIAGSHDVQVASDLLIGNPVGHRSTPLSAGRLRGCLLRPDFMVHRACSVGKCQNQVTYSCAIGMLQRTVSTWVFLCTHHGLPSDAMKAGGSSRCRKSAVPPSADASWVQCSGHYAKSRD
jgi:hypothetical protein